MTNINPTQPVVKKEASWKIWLAATGTAALFMTLGLFRMKSVNPWDFLQSTDDLVRMVTVRDWMAGQGWFDPYLHRLGYEPGTLMHWSRLVDTPIAFLIWVGNFFGNGERFAAIAWPFITFIIAFAAVLTAVRRATGSDNLIPSFIVAGFALWSAHPFDPGVIDHHNVQAALALWLVASVLPSRNDVFNLTLAAIVTALSLAVGMEALPVAVAGALAVCLRLLIERDAFYEAAARYGISLAISMAVLFFCLIGPQAYSKTYCDSLSLFQFSSAIIGGVLLYVGLLPRVRRFFPAPYIIVPAIAGAVVVVVIYLAFPACLSDPIAIDPLLKHFWLDSITEAQNVFQIAKSDQFYDLVFIYPLLLIAVGALVWKLIKKDQPLLAGILLVFLLVAIPVVMFQVRGIKQALPIAGLALSIVMTRFMDNGGKQRPLTGLAALLVCCNFFWLLVAVGVMELANNKAATTANVADDAGINLCRTQSDLDVLLSEKPGFIAAANGLGPWILFNTNHRVLAGPYHRNTEGNLDALKIMIGPEQEAQAVMKKGGVTLFMACPKFADEAQILREVPNGFLGQLLGGKTPDWLEPIASTMDKDLKIWRVRS